MKVRFGGKNNNTIFYTPGMTNDDAIAFLKKRMADRQRKIDQRAWIVKEYNSLVAKQELDSDWCRSLQSGNVVLSKSKE